MRCFGLADIELDTGLGSRMLLFQDPFGVVGIAGIGNTEGSWAAVVAVAMMEMGRGVDTGGCRSVALVHTVHTAVAAADLAVAVHIGHVAVVDHIVHTVAAAAAAGVVAALASTSDTPGSPAGRYLQLWR